MESVRKKGKVMKKNILWWEPKVGAQEIGFIKQVLESNFLNDGEVTDEFEKKLAGLLGCTHAVAVTSGTAALFLSLAALGVGKGDEVVVPDVTFIATANAVSLTGAKAVLVDVDPDTMNLSPQAFDSCITKRTKAVVPVHVSGRAANMEEIMCIADKRGIYVVEDAAEALMSKHNGRYLGTFGKTGCLSFSPNKTITTGQGGVITTNDDKLHIRLRELKDQGRSVRGTGGDDIHNSVGYNFKLTNVQAAIGMGQLFLLEGRLSRIKEIYSLYNKYLDGVKELILFKFNIREGESPQWVDATAEKRNEMEKYLRKRGIFCRKYWHPLHTQRPYKETEELFPVSSTLSKKAIWLPSAFTLSDADIKLVCSTIKKFYSSR